EHAVALAAVGHYSLYGTIGIETVDGKTVLKDRLMTQVTWIAEIDASLLVDADIVERVVGPPVIETAEDVGLAGLHVGLDQHTAAVIGAQRRDHVAFAIELDAVRHPARAAENGGLTVLRVVLPDVAGLRVLAG